MLILLLLLQSIHSCGSNEATLLRLKFYRAPTTISKAPTTIHTTLAIFRTQFERSISIQSILDPTNIYNTSFTTPQQITTANMHRPGLAGMLSMTCGTMHHFNTPLTYVDQCNTINNNNNNNDEDQDQDDDWLYPPKGLLILPRTKCNDGSTVQHSSKQDYLSRAIQSALGQTTFNTNELITGFILTWENDMNENENGILEHALVRGKTAANRKIWMKEVLEMLTNTCTLSQIPPNQQIIFPPGVLIYTPSLTSKSSSTTTTSSSSSTTTATTSTASTTPTTSTITSTKENNKQNDKPLVKPVQQWRPSIRKHVTTHTFVIASPPPLPFKPSAISSNDPLPPYPNYCSTSTLNRSDGTSPKHLPHIEKALRAYHESAFIEDNAKMMEFPIPFVDTILEFIMKLVLPALLNPFAEYYVKEVSGRVSDEMGPKIVADVPEDVVKLLTPPLTYNVTNLLTDALTASVSKNIITALTMEFGAPIVLQLTENLMKSLYKVLDPFMNVAIPEKLTNVLPYLMERSLPITLTRRLTRSLTHALVPTLSRSLSSGSKNSHQRYWCDMCSRKALHCNYCHDSPQSQYYTNFYANYYSDYYVDYYEPYYTKALSELDRVQHPPAKQQEAKEHNNGGKGLKKGLAPDASYRAVTADGGKLSDDGVVF